MNTLLPILLILFLVWSFYLLIRNFAVLGFCQSLNHACALQATKHINGTVDFNDEWYKEHERIHKLWDEITGISYERMLFSFAPLKPEYWLNDEQLEFLGYGTVH